MSLKHTSFHSVPLTFQMACEFNGDREIIDPTGMFVFVMKEAQDLGLRAA